MAALRAFITIGIAAFWLLIVAPPMFMNPPSVVTGVHLIITGAVIQPPLVRVDKDSPAYRGGLRTGDVLGCLSARDFALLILPSFGYIQGYRTGTPISTCVRRNGELRTIAFTATTGPPIPQFYGTDALAVVRIVVVLVFFFTGIALVLARPSLLTWLFYVYCIWNAPSFAASQVWTILPPWQYAVVNGTVAVGVSLAVSVLLLFSLLVPQTHVPPGWRRVAFYIAIAIMLGDAYITIESTLLTGAVVAPGFTDTVDEALTGLTIMVIVTRLATMRTDERARFGWAAFAIVFGIVTNDLRNVLSLGAATGWISVIAADLTIVMPLCLMYAILRRHVIDVRFVISRTVVYAALTTIIVLAIGLVDWATSAYLTQVRLAMAIDAGVTIVLALVLHRAYAWTESVVDFLLFRRKHEAERYLERAAHSLLFAKTETAVDKAVVQDAHDKLDLTAAALYRACSAGTYAATRVQGWGSLTPPEFDVDHDLVRFMLAERTKIAVGELRSHIAEPFRADGGVPTVAIPIFQGDRLTAFALYGMHRDGTKLDPDEIETLEHLCAAASQAYTSLELAHYQSEHRAFAIQTI